MQHFFELEMIEIEIFILRTNHGPYNFAPNAVEYTQYSVKQYLTVLGFSAANDQPSRLRIIVKAILKLKINVLFCFRKESQN